MLFQIHPQATVSFIALKVQRWAYERFLILARVCARIYPVVFYGDQLGVGLSSKAFGIKKRGKALWHYPAGFTSLYGNSQLFILQAG